MGDNVQEKYNQIMTITLQKLETPLRNSEAVLDRIAALLEVNLPQKKKPPATAAQAQQIMIRLTQAENLSNALLFLEGALQQLNYEPPIPLWSPAQNLPDPGVTQTIRSRADLDALLDAISLSGVGAPGQAAGMLYGQPAAVPAPAAAVGPPAAAAAGRPAQAARPVTYSDFEIDDPRKRDGPTGFSISDSTPKPAPDLSGYIINRPTTTTSTSTTPTTPGSPQAVSPTPAAALAPPPAAAAPKPSGDPDSLENVSTDDLMKRVPKWTKGPPCSSEEIDEYKAFMVAKYEAEQKVNAEILRRKKLGIS